MEEDWLVSDALQALKRGSPEHRIDIASRFPLLATARLEEIVETALQLVSASVLEHALVSKAHASKEQRGCKEETDFLAAQYCPEDLEKARELLAPKKKALKTQPIIVIETGDVLRPQGRPPRDAKPLYARTMEEAQQLLQQQKQNKKE